MKCLNDAEITIFLDKEMDPQKEKRVQQHINVCPHCNTLHERISRERLFVLGLLQTRPDPQTELLFPVIGRQSKRKVSSLAWAASFIVALITWVSFSLFHPPQKDNKTKEAPIVCLVQTADLQLHDLSVQGVSAEPFLFEAPALQTTFVWAASAPD